MPYELTLAEVEQDLENTIRDEQICSHIATLVRRFIVESGGEDRTAFNVDARKWEGLARQASRLKTLIEAKRRELKGETP